MIIHSMETTKQRKMNRTYYGRTIKKENLISRLVNDLILNERATNGKKEKGY